MNDKDILTAIGSYVASHGIGTLGRDLWLGTMPATPAIAVGIFQNPATRIVGARTHRKAYQVMIRDKDAGAAFTKANTIFGLFDDVWNALCPVSKGRFVCASDLGLGWVDESNLTTYTINVNYFVNL